MTKYPKCPECGGQRCRAFRYHDHSAGGDAVMRWPFVGGSVMLVLGDNPRLRLTTTFLPTLEHLEELEAAYACGKSALLKMFD